MRAGLLTGVVVSTALLVSSPAAAQIETLVMPGDVIENHAEFEAECSNCHEAFNRSGQRKLCLDCHEDVASDIEDAAGFHGRDTNASTETCASCHTDHEGRNAEIVVLDKTRFDHTLTDFELHGKHAKAQCGDCHASGERYRDAPGDCFACHEKDNVHDEFLGQQCGDCHTADGWLDVAFDHDQTGFLLVGGHADAACLDCHADQTFQDTPTTCYGCHADDDIHNGLSGTQCDSCHSPHSWTDTSFDHARDTRFALEGSHASLACGDCHSDEPFADELEPACVSCHVDDDEHDGHFGERCESCHRSDDWSRVRFNHEADTGHLLLGAHSATECESCHVEPVFDVALQSDCLSCHRDDDAHDGTQGIHCDDCHNEVNWQDDVFFDHGLTRFPLLGVHARTECGDCHDSHVFSDAPTACVDCHQADDYHDGRFGSECASCHNPVDWSQWQFDHDVQTRFSLDGAHEDVACDACHRSSLDDQWRLGDSCGGCHRNDDVHDGEFGPDCGRCHSSDTFTDVRSIR